MEILSTRGRGETARALGALSMARCTKASSKTLALGSGGGSTGRSGLGGVL